MTLKTKFDYIFDELRLQPFLKQKLLEESLGRLTGTEVALRILRELGRMDVKVCLIQGDQNCYSPMLNWVGLSENVAGSRSVLAAAIAAHEVGHALQFGFIEKLGRYLKDSSIFSFLSFSGEMFMVLPRIFELFFQWALSIKSQEREQDSTQGNEIHQSQQNPKHYSFIKLTHLIFLVIALWKWFVILLFFPINLLIGLVWVVIFGILVLISICCALISRWLIFLIELDASWRALRLLKQYKVLDIRQQKAARKFLLACALTYLGSFVVEGLFA